MTTLQRNGALYWKIWAVLILAVCISVGVSRLGHPTLANVLIFGVATVKAILVALFYMGLHWEPKYVPVILMVALLCLVIAGFGLMPDVVYVYGD